MNSYKRACTQYRHRAQARAHIIHTPHQIIRSTHMGIWSSRVVNGDERKRNDILKRLFRVVTDIFIRFSSRVLKDRPMKMKRKERKNYIFYMYWNWICLHHHFDGIQWVYMCMCLYIQSIAQNQSSFNTERKFWIALILQYNMYAVRQISAHFTINQFHFEWFMREGKKTATSEFHQRFAHIFEKLSTLSIQIK